jgi:hypothetical protein
MSNKKNHTNKETSSRTLLVTSAILIVLGVVVISPVAGVATLFLSALFALTGVCLGFKRYGKIGLVLLIIGIALMTGRFQDARNDYGQYLDRAEMNAANSGR